MRPLAWLWYWFVIALVRHVFFRILGGLYVVGKENVPRAGAVLFAPNHVSYLDPPAVSCASPRRVCFMAKEELFKVFGFGWIIRSLGAFPVRRGERDSEAIRKAIDILKAGDSLILFPEGTRGDGAHLGVITPGIAMLAKRAQAQVVPVAVVGTHIAWPKNSKKIRRSKIIVAFGQPFTYEELAKGENEQENRQLFVDHLSSQLIELCAKQQLFLKLPNTKELILESQVISDTP